MSRERFEPAYQGQPPWDVPGPQPVFVQLEEAGEIRGSVLDSGCGTGENALYLASRGHEVMGVDVVPVAIERARDKAQQRGLNVRFEVADALELDRLGRQFDSVIDSGLFHTFDDELRAAYVRSLGAAVRPGGTYHMVCFSDQEPPGEGPRRITPQEIRDAFRDGWEVQSIREARFETVSGPGMPRFSPGGPRAWLATIARTGSER
ncbi:MAG TPA: methyltransferase domain-containing protein [Isosphaeraceae bacterium]|nr:methyltransferase domain-containing protein [Isosphaeraceae bacterium]